MNERFRQFVINDFKLPKIVARSPYFETQYSLISEYGVDHAFGHVRELINDFDGSDELFFREVNDLSHHMFKAAFEMYSNSFNYYRNRYNPSPYNETTPIHRKSLMNPETVDRSYIRIDIRQACFNVLQKLTDEMTHTSFHTFVHSFSAYDYEISEYVACSKRIRSYIFGSIQKQLIIQLEKYIIGTLMKKINLELVYKSCDEAVYHYTDENEKIINDVIKDSPYADILRVETFFLSGIDGGYVELHDDGNVIFKCVPSDMFCEVYANYYGYTMLDGYRVFKHNDHLCMRLE